jgi:hypothetical protein
MATNFPHMDDLIKTYFHQDYDLIANDIEGLMHHYVTTTSQAQRDVVRTEIAQYLSVRTNDLDEKFKNEYEYDVAPEAWGYSTEDFLRKIATLIK